MSVTDANDATRTTFCRVDSCTSEARWTAGPLKGLCELHAEPTRQRMRESQRKPKPAVGEVSFAARAKSLVRVGSKLDQAVANYRKQQQRIQPAKDALDQAMREWRVACRELAGEGDQA